jgi:hypothetical protein
MKIFYLILTAIIFFLIGYFTSPLISELLSTKEQLQFELEVNVDKTRDTVDIGIASQDSTMVAFVFGQSNATNFAEKRYTPKHNVYNYYDGILYTAVDPLLGCDGSLGSVWSVLGDLIIEKGLYKNVVFIPVGIGNTSVEGWAETDLVGYLAKRLEQVKKDNITITHFLWHQGEKDNIINTGKQTYKKRIEKLLKNIRNQGFDAPFFVSIDSYAPVHDRHPLGLDPEIQSAQIEFINETEGVFCGSNTDTLIHAIHRRDATHFTEYGNQLYAKQWLDALVNPSEVVKSFSLCTDTSSSGY